MNTITNSTHSPISSLLAKSQFLEKHPWPEEWLKKSKPLDFLWHHDLEASIEKLWPLLSDTSTFNRIIGVPKMDFTEKEGKLYGKSVNAGFTLEWEELPWQWEYCVQLSCARIYSVGFTYYVRARFFFERLSAEKTRFYVYFGWIPKGLTGRILLNIGMRQIQSGYEETLAVIENHLKKSEALLSQEEKPSLTEEVKKSLTHLRKELTLPELDQTIIDKVFQLLYQGGNDELYRIRVKQLAQKWDCDERELLLIFLHATQKGLFFLTWDVICPHCRGARQEVKNLGEIPKEERCEACDIGFETTRIDALEVTFHPHPSIRNVTPVYYCSAEPAKKAHIKIQKELSPLETLTLKTRIGPGSYRLRSKGMKENDFLEIKDKQEKELGTNLFWEGKPEKKLYESNPYPEIKVKNSSNQKQTFILEEMINDKLALRPADLFNFQDFRDLFSEEAIASNLKLDIGSQTIMFTDIVGSTRFYEVEGDANAFAEVRKHFIIIYEIVKKHHGAIVKTIGDAAMATFREPVAALKSAIELQHYFREENKENRLRIRISLNTGSCLAVNLNSNIDYFGSAINLTAKLQKVTDAGQLVFTEFLYKDPLVEQILEEEKHQVEKLDFPLDWSEGSIPVYRVKIS